MKNLNSNIAPNAYPAAYAPEYDRGTGIYLCKVKN